MHDILVRRNVGFGVHSPELARALHTVLFLVCHGTAVLTGPLAECLGLGRVFLDSFLVPLVLVQWGHLYRQWTCVRGSVLCVCQAVERGGHGDICSLVVHAIRVVCRVCRAGIVGNDERDWELKTHRGDTRHTIKRKVRGWVSVADRASRLNRAGVEREDRGEDDEEQF